MSRCPWCGRSTFYFPSVPAVWPCVIPVSNVPTIIVWPGSRPSSRGDAQPVLTQPPTSLKGEEGVQVPRGGLPSPTPTRAPTPSVIDEKRTRTENHNCALHHSEPSFNQITSFDSHNKPRRWALFFTVASQMRKLRLNHCGFLRLPSCWVARPGC